MDKVTFLRSLHSILWAMESHRSLKSPEEFFQKSLDELDCLVHSYREANKLGESAEEIVKKHIKDSYE